MLETGEISKLESFITIGDEYKDKKERPLHETPGVRQFQTTGGVKRGQTGGDWGENYRSVKPLYSVRTTAATVGVATQPSINTRALRDACCRPGRKV